MQYECKTCSNRSDLSITPSPDLLAFSAKMLPGHQPTAKTKWKPVNSRIFALDFTLGPLVMAHESNSTLCIRLHGKSRKIGRAHETCYGECSIATGSLWHSGETVVKLEDCYRKRAT